MSLLKLDSPLQNNNELFFSKYVIWAVTNNVLICWLLNYLIIHLVNKMSQSKVT